MNDTAPSAICYGEILWDIFPDHKAIGGAPLNVALRLKALGIAADIISRVGNDADGKAALAYLKKNGLSGNCVQIDRHYQTGAVDVVLDKTGSATYNIVHPVAWDKIAYTQEAVDIVQKSSAFIFGSLVCRDEISKNTLFRLIPHASYKIFDVNLRPPFYSTDLLLKLMTVADFIKCNDEELAGICKALKCKSETMEGQLSSLSEKTNTAHLCVTLGKDGAVLLYEGDFYKNKGYKVKVADTVGAGDSFLAALIGKLLKNENPAKALEFACAVGALAASKAGANAEISEGEVKNLIQS